tara:strand:+ start:230 stop:466 length:237 start_codon:yes stop_codon:yes gene_type:complete
MPWQMAPPLIVICGCFTATGVLLRGMDNAYYGRNKRIMIDEYIFALDVRDKEINAWKNGKVEPKAKRSVTDNIFSPHN